MQNESLRQEIQSAQAESIQLKDLRSKIIADLAVGELDQDIFDGINNLKQVIKDKDNKIDQLAQDLSKLNTEL